MLQTNPKKRSAEFEFKRTYGNLAVLLGQMEGCGYRTAFDEDELEYYHDTLLQICRNWKELLVSCQEAKHFELRVKYERFGVWVDGFEELLNSKDWEMYFDYYDAVLEVTKIFVDQRIIKYFYRFVPGRKKGVYKIHKHILVTKDMVGEDNCIVPYYCDVSDLPLPVTSDKYRKSLKNVSPEEAEKLVRRYEKYQIPIHKYVNSKFAVMP